jgi:hypothetical protein
MLDTDPEEFIPPMLLKRTDPKPRPLSTAAITATMTIIESIHEVLDTFISMEARELRNLPAVTWVRMGYCTSLLIKISILVTLPTSGLNTLLGVENLKVEFYIKNLLTRISAAIRPEETRVPSIFLQIVGKLGTWYHQRQSQLHPKVGESHQQPMVPFNNLDIEKQTMLHDTGSMQSTSQLHPTTSGSQIPSFPIENQPINYGSSNTPVRGDNNITSNTLESEVPPFSSQSLLNGVSTDSDMDYLSMYSNTEYDGSLDNLNLWFPIGAMDFESMGQEFNFNFNN